MIVIKKFIVVNMHEVETYWNGSTH